jgi:4-hydroxybenzoate polyprenyltransferase
VTAPVEGRRLSLPELGEFLEVQNLGLNLPFALAFLALAARGVPPAIPTLLLIVAFVAARNAGHSFNRWADRDLDARNPRTRDRALVTGRVSPRFALAFAVGMSVVLVAAAYLLNPLALVLSPVALFLVFGYSWTKRRTAWTTVFLGLVESVTPAAVYIGLTGSLPAPVLLAVLALLLWGTAFETVHSLGDLATDRALGLPTVPGRIGTRASVRLVPALHGSALVLLALFGWAEALRPPYFVALLAMAAVAALTDWTVAKDPERSARPFRYHFVLGGLFFAGAVASLVWPV